MLISAELRWFWKDSAPAGLESWFKDATATVCAAGGGRERCDKYLADGGQVELGIKERDAKPDSPAGTPAGYEVKGLVAVKWVALPGWPLGARMEVWTKWTSKALVIDEKLLVPITKTRWLRKFDTAGRDPLEIPLNDKEEPIDERRRGVGLPALGCHVEVTRVATPKGDTWWTFGLEAFGDLQTVEGDLCAVVNSLTARRLPPVSGGLALSYPAWLRDYRR
jgi:hypothetical protein